MCVLLCHLQAEELKREEEEKREIEERERREQEEYLKMKAAFSVEGEGFDEEGEDDSEKNLLQEFITYVKVRLTINYSSTRSSIIYI